MSSIKQELVAKAKEALQRAYAPYSGYSVGAALLGADGTIFVGCNVENASYGLTICAERAAVCAAVAAGCRQFQAMAIVVEGSDIARPCGACRQVLAEFSPNLPLYLANTQGQVEEMSLADLLPLAFTPQSLGQDKKENL